VWDKVTPFLLDPQNIRQVASVLVEKWQGNREQHQADVERLERQLERLAEERQWVIIQGRKGVLTQSDMEAQLGLLSGEERDTRRELTDTRQTVTASAGLFAMMTELAGFLRDNQGELIELAAVPLREMSLEQLKAAQRWVDAVVERVDLVGDGSDLKLQTNPFGLLHTVFSKSTPVNSH
jgi:hypothetical protein